MMSSCIHRAASILLVALLTLATGCASDKRVISQANAMHDTIEPAVIEDPVLANYLQTVGQRVIDAAREIGPPKGDESSAWMFSNSMRFHFVNSKTLNAFTTGGEHMYIYTALFLNCKTEDELAAVVAHEFAHVYGRHVHSGMNNQLAIMGIAAGAGLGGYLVGGDEKGGEYATAAAGLALVGGQVVGMGFTRDDEREADELGFKFYTRAGWDPDRFGDFFQSMIDKGHDTTPEFLSSHPTLASRVQAARQRAKKVPQPNPYRRPPVADPQTFQQLQARAVEVGRSMPDDQSLDKAQTLLQAFPNSCVMPTEQPEQLEARAEIERAIKEREAAQRKQSEN